MRDAPRVGTVTDGASVRYSTTRPDRPPRSLSPTGKVRARSGHAPRADGARPRTARGACLLRPAGPGGRLADGGDRLVVESAVGGQDALGVEVVRLAVQAGDGPA